MGTDVIGYVGNLTYDNIQNCYDHWHTIYQPVLPNYYFVQSNTYEDKGVKALTIIKTLMKKKLLKLDTVEQFVDVMDELVKVL